MIPFSFAIFSADCPIVSPVADSASAGASGARSFGRSLLKRASFPPIVFCLLAATSVSANFREKRIGTVESDSAPPATAVLA